MTLKEFMTLLRAETIGELSPPKEPEEIGLLINSVVISHIAEALPISLIESDPEKAESLFPVPIDDEYFIRKPKLAVNEDDVIDLDEELCLAAVYLVAAKYVRNSAELNNKKLKEDAAKKIISSYIWRSYEYLESLKEKRCHDHR